MQRFLGFLVVGFALLVAGCGQETVNLDQLIERDGVAYKIDSDQPFTGTAIQTDKNGKKKLDGKFKNGKKVGKWTWWDEYGEKVRDYDFDQEKYLM